MCDADRGWLVRHNYEKRVAYFGTVWDMYLKFYTVFLTLNIAGIGLSVEHIKAPLDRWPVAFAFVVQNLLSTGTAIYVAFFSKNASLLVEELAREISPEVSRIGGRSPLPSRLAQYGAWANAASHIVLIVIWLCLPYFGA